MSFTNHVVDEVVVINLKKDTKKLESITNQLEKEKIMFERFDAVNGKTLENRHEFTSFCNKFCASGIRGCALSHYSVWNSILTKGFENIMILEDDAVLVENFDEKFSLIYNSIPKDFDILYLGSLFYCDPSEVFNKVYRYKNEKINEHVLRTEGCGGLQGYIISRNCIQKIINEKISFHIDTNLMEWIKKYNLKTYAITPMLITQNMSDSNLSATYPLLLNKVLHTIHLTNNVTLDWLVNEAGYTFGPFTWCTLPLIILFLGVLIPLRYYFLFYIWLIVELIASKDLKNTFVYGILLSIPFLIKYTK